MLSAGMKRSFFFEFVAISCYLNLKSLFELCLSFAEANAGDEKTPELHAWNLKRPVHEG